MARKQKRTPAQLSNGSKAGISFLKLPAEVRNMIYSFVLGHQTIHINYPGGNMSDLAVDALGNLPTATAYICRVSISDTESVKHSREEQERCDHVVRISREKRKSWDKGASWDEHRRLDESNSPDEGNSLYECPSYDPSEKFYYHDPWLYCQRHLECTGAISTSIALNFLLTCRQMYQEAALTIFKENRFTFFSPRDIMLLSRRLSRAQMRAIRNVVVYQAHARREWDASVKQRSVARLLRGVQHLEVFVELCPADYTIYNHADEEHIIEVIEAQSRCLSGLRFFKQPGLRSVELDIVETHHRCLLGAEAQTFQKALIEAWPGNIRRMLLGDDSVAAEKGEMCIQTLRASVLRSLRERFDRLWDEDV